VAADPDFATTREGASEPLAQFLVSQVNVFPSWENFAETLLPKNVTAVMATMAMNATRTPYSARAAPSSSLKNRPARSRNLIRPHRKGVVSHSDWAEQDMGFNPAICVTCCNMLRTNLLTVCKGSGYSGPCLAA